MAVGGQAASAGCDNPMDSMISTRPTFAVSTYRIQAPVEKRHGLESLFAAAVVSRDFRRTLLEDPESALRNGYRGEVFELTSEERERLLSAGARSLADLARELTAP